MNTILKIGVAGALTMGFASAHASIAQVSSSKSGDVLLFAEVLTSANAVVGSYAGDTGVTVHNLFSGATASGTILSSGSDTALASLLSLAAANPTDTVQWAVIGGGGTGALPVSTPNYGTTGAAEFVTTNTANPPTQLASRTGGNLSNWSSLTNTISSVQANAGAGKNSVFAASAAAGGIWDVTLAPGTSAVNDWYNNGSSNSITGLSTVATLYNVTGGGSVTAQNLLTTNGTVSLTSSGLVYTAGGGTTVPLPAAVWLLGSGLLGLAGVGRRKISV